MIDTVYCSLRSFRKLHVLNDIPKTETCLQKRNFVITSVQMSTSHHATIITDFLTWKLSNVARCLEWISFTSLNGKFQNKFQPLMKITL